MPTPICHWAGFGGNSGQGAASEIDQDLAKRVVETLEPVVGSQGVRASVHVEYDLSSGEETQETYDPSSSVPLSVTRSEEHLGSDALGGVPGTSSNLPNAKVNTPSKSGSESHTSKAESGTYAVNKLVRHTVQPAGKDQAYCGRVAGGRCGASGAEEQSASRHPPPPHS